MTAAALTATAPSSTTIPDTTPRPKPKSKPASKLPVSSGTESDSVVVIQKNQSRRAPTAPSTDPLSDKATSALIRRALCPQLRNEKNRHGQPPIEELLPPLTSRNDVDLQLYAFLAIILREFVQSWYNKMTTDDSFVTEVVHIVAHCTRALEQRCRTLDLESLILDEIPDLIDKHITAYRAAHHSLSTSPIEIDPRQVYHAMCPLPLLSPIPQSNVSSTILEQRENEAAYRQLLVRGVLAILLPTEDLENPCLTALVGQIFSESIIGNVVANKVAQPWMLWEIICILARVVEEKREKEAEEEAKRLRSLSTGRKPQKWTVHAVFLSMIHAAMFFITTIRILVSVVVTSASLPFRSSPSVDEQMYDENPDTHHKSAQPFVEPSRVAILDFRIWSCMANMIELPLRMPWLHGCLSLMRQAAANGPGRVGHFNGILDRMLSHHIQSLLSPSHLPSLLRTLRGLLFPNNAPGKASLFPPESDDQLLALRRRAAVAIWDLVPRAVGRMYLGKGRIPEHDHNLGKEKDEKKSGDEELVDEIEGLLMVFSDEYCNKHLMYGVLELILVRLMPELAEKGVEELWDERLG